MQLLQDYKEELSNKDRAERLISAERDTTMTEKNIVMVFDGDNNVLSREECRDADTAYRLYCDKIDAFKSMADDYRFPPFYRTIARYRQMGSDTQPRLMHSEIVEKR